MRTILTLILFISPLCLSAQEFYDLNTIQSIEITFAESNWDQLLDAQKAGAEDYIMAQTVVINGTAFDSVGVKYKGNSTYNTSYTKNPFHIELDTYKDQSYQGYKDIKLSNVAKDPSFLREVLSYQILRQYMQAPLSNYANVYVNGDLIGLYSNSEAITKTFVSDRFGSKKNTFIKCNPPAGAGPQSTDFPNLTYQGQDSTSYYAAYEIKSDAGWQELIDLTDTLANHTDAIESMIDVDAVLWMLAFDNVLVNLDSYIGGFAQNYYLYRDEFGIFNPIVWDLNESLGVFTQTGSGNLTSTTSKQQMDLFLHENDASYPLIQKLLSVPTYRKRYVAHCQTMVEENFSNGSYASTAQTLANVIDAAVQADNNKFFTYQNFVSNLNSDIAGGGQGNRGAPGITNLMDGRNAYLTALNDFSAAAPSITNVELSNSAPIIGESIDITVSGGNASSLFLNYRTVAYAPFTSVEMFDDGAHGDGAADDGVFGTNFNIEASLTEYYFYGENELKGKFLPQRAAHEYFKITATLTDPTTVGDLVINEFMASNDAVVADQDGEFDDWIELYNNGTSTISLDGYFLSDDPAFLFKFAIPDGNSIEPNDYLIFWADDDEGQDGLHTNFKLSAASESVFIVDPAGNIIDEVSYVDQEADVSFGRFPNGTGDFRKLDATFGSENLFEEEEPLAVTTFDENQGLLVYPNPAKGTINIKFQDQQTSLQEVSVLDLNGKIVFKSTILNEIQIGTKDWSTGVYLIKTEGLVQRIIVLK